jgi:hypothetical protein
MSRNYKCHNPQGVYFVTRCRTNFTLSQVEVLSCGTQTLIFRETPKINEPKLQMP